MGEGGGGPLVLTNGPSCDQEGGVKATETLTLDANVVFGAADGKDAGARKIIELAKTGRIDIAVASRIKADAGRDRDEVRRQRSLSFVERIPILASTGRWDISFWDEDVWDSVGGPTLTRRLEQVLFPGGLDLASRRIHNKLCDLDGLEAHIAAGRGIFVTRDKDILSKSAVLQSEFGTTVLTPEEVLALLPPE